MTMPGLRLAYLGPEGTFTHEAALGWAERLGAEGGPPIELVPLRRSEERRVGKECPV